MAWIESHQTLQRHPKVIGLAAKARLSKAAVIGHLHMLWWWAMDYAPTGDLSQFDPSLVAAAAEWDGDSDNWMTLLKEFRWVDQDGHLHNWEQYAGRLLEIRKKDRKRKSERRAEDVRRMSDGHPADVHRPSGVPNPTQPNQPNNYIPPPTRARADSELPSRDGAIAQASMQSVPDSFSAYVWDDWESRGGKDSAGNPVPWLRYVIKRWSREKAEWKAGTHKGNKTCPSPIQGAGRAKAEDRMVPEEIKVKML